MGLLIYSAINHGFGEDEERNISSDLESLLDSMVSAGECTLLWIFNLVFLFRILYRFVVFLIS